MPTTAATAPVRKSKAVQPRCEDCYFGRRGLCALNLGEPCSTFRAEGPRGIVPPTQPSLMFIEAGAEVEAEPEDSPGFLAA